MPNPLPEYNCPLNDTNIWDRCDDVPSECYSCKFQWECYEQDRWDNIDERCDDD